MNFSKIHNVGYFLKKIMEWKNINLYGEEVVWLIVPENTTDTLRHYNRCKSILDQAQKIFLEHIFALNIICVIFDEQNDYAKTLSSLFVEEKQPEFESIGFKDDNIKRILSINVPVKNGLFEGEKILLIAPESALISTLK